MKKRILATLLVSFLLPNVVDRAVAGVGILVDLAVADTLKAARTGQARAESADPGKHVKKAYQMVSSPSCSARRKPRTSASTSPACSGCGFSVTKETP